MRPERAPLKALNLAPGLAPILTRCPVMAAWRLGLKYIAYSSPAAAVRTIDYRMIFTR